jgi:hypothetical protein
MKKNVTTTLNAFLNESKLDNLSKQFKLKKVDALSRAYDAANKNIIDEYDLHQLEDIYQLIEKGEIKKAQKKISRLDSLVKPYAPDIPLNKIKGSIVVEFEMSSEFLDRNEMIEHMKIQLEHELTKEWQTSRCYPDMDTFNC